MGWAARLNTFSTAKWRMQRLKELCQLLPRDQVEAAIPQMPKRDQPIVRRILNQVQPRA